MKKSKKNVSKYVQDSLLEFDSLATTLKENASDAVKDLLDESVRKTYRELLAEESGKDDDVEDEVEDTDDEDVDVSDFGAKSKDARKAKDDDDDDDFEADFEDEDGRGHVSFKSGKDGKGGKWAQFSKYKVSDGEYDFTNAEDDEIVNAYNMLGDDDKVVVTKDDDSHINVKDNETGTEYIIDLDTMDAEKAGEDGDEFSDDSLNSYVDDELSDVEDDLMGDLGGDDDDDTEIEVELDEPEGGSDDDEEDEVEYLVPDDEEDDDENNENGDDDKNNDINEGVLSDFMKNGLDKAKNLVDKFFDGLDKPNPMNPDNNFFVDDEEEFGDDEEDDENKKKHKKMKNESKIFEIYLNEDDNLGYTDNYQKDDVMTSPGMDEPGNNVNDWDRGVPKGKSKPWSGYKGQKSADQPFNEGLIREFGEYDDFGGDIPSEDELRELLGGNEYVGSPEDEEELEAFRRGKEEGEDYPVDFDDSEILGDGEPTEECGGLYSEEDDFGFEEGGHTFGKVQAHSTAKTYLRNNPYEDAYEDTIGSASKGGRYHGRKRKGEGVDESIRRIYRENKQLKKALLRFKGSLQEAALTNVNLGQIIKLLSENATTFDEKKEIISRFGNEVNSIKDSKRLYESISRELKRKGGLALNEGRQYGVLGSRKLNETQIYQDKGMLQSLDLMHKLCK